MIIKETRHLSQKKTRLKHKTTTVHNNPIIPISYLVESPQAKEPGHLNYHFLREWKQGDRKFSQGDIWMTSNNQLALILFLRYVNSGGSLSHRKYMNLILYYILEQI